MRSRTARGRRGKYNVPERDKETRAGEKAPIVKRVSREKTEEQVAGGKGNRGIPGAPGSARRRELARAREREVGDRIPGGESVERAGRRARGERERRMREAERCVCGPRAEGRGRRAEAAGRGGRTSSREEMGHGRGPSETAVRKRSCRGRDVSPVHAIFSLVWAASRRGIYARRVRSRSTERCRECRVVRATGTSCRAHPVAVPRRAPSPSIRRACSPGDSIAIARGRDWCLREEQSSERRSRIGRRTFSAPSFHFPRGATPTSLLTLEDSDEIRSHGRTQEARRFAAGHEEERI